VHVWMILDGAAQPILFEQYGSSLIVENYVEVKCFILNY